MAKELIRKDLTGEAEIDFYSSVTQRDLTGMIEREEKKVLKLKSGLEAII